MSSLTNTVAHAVSLLTQPLAKAYSPQTIVKLQLVLEANLTALYAESWDVHQPMRGSARRCLVLSPDCLPPRAIYAACIAAGVQWFDWIALLGGKDVEFFVDPGCISMRLERTGPDSELIPLWVAQTPAPRPIVATCVPIHIPRTKTMAQQLLEDDVESDEQIFTMLSDEACAPTWFTPVVAEFPKSRSISPISAPSRCSSRSSNSSSSGSTFSSVESSPSMSEGPRMSRRDRARQARVFIDTSKNEVTPYDGGKTTVLTGGVMLGGAPKPARSRHNNSNDAYGWRVRI
ncbi:unnamed protein product [Mycena citricolor]|uniref:Anti-proliferative protein domain-containing protein n=1 Tax=Mycena citricolor TaxID=2018698 RepID=A0AAD2K3Z2_9AGAR|nr:unnamed protein product [Mycena citricolor]